MSGACNDTTSRYEQDPIASSIRNYLENPPTSPWAPIVKDGYGEQVRCDANGWPILRATDGESLLNNPDGSPRVTKKTMIDDKSLPAIFSASDKPLRTFPHELSFGWRPDFGGSKSSSRYRAICVEIIIPKDDSHYKRADFFHESFHSRLFPISGDRRVENQHFRALAYMIEGETDSTWLPPPSVIDCEKIGDRIYASTHCFKFLPMKLKLFGRREQLRQTLRALFQYVPLAGVKDLLLIKFGRVADMGFCLKQVKPDSTAMSLAPGHCSSHVALFCSATLKHSKFGVKELSTGEQASGFFPRDELEIDKVVDEVRTKDLLSLDAVNPEWYNVIQWEFRDGEDNENDGKLQYRYQGYIFSQDSRG
ncbi:hypothetical protein GGR57DRAFT_470290 [Xylariaceae sp. FL1272]|nr:hypothetical protein GGR57DRAFT_470290 [Xylariaceae sp. FL1272]